MNNTNAERVAELVRENRDLKRELHSYKVSSKAWKHIADLETKRADDYEAMYIKEITKDKEAGR